MDDEILELEKKKLKKKSKKKAPNLNKVFYDMTNEPEEIKELIEKPLVKFFKGVRTIFINDEPDRFNPYLNKLAAHHDEQKAKEIK